MDQFAEMQLHNSQKGIGQSAGRNARTPDNPIPPPSTQDTISSILGECLAVVHELNGSLRQISHAVLGPVPEPTISKEAKEPSIEGLRSLCGEIRRQVAIAHEHTARIGNSVGC